MKIRIKTLIKLNQFIWAFSVLFCLCNLMISNPLDSTFIANVIQAISIDIFNSVSGGEPSDITNFVNF